MISKQTIITAAISGVISFGTVMTTLHFTDICNNNTDVEMYQESEPVNDPVDDVNVQPSKYIKSKDVEKLSLIIRKRYSVVDKATADTIARSAIKYESRKGFPSRYDIISVIAVETAFNCSAVSSVGAVGCMQVNPKAWPDINRYDLNNIDKSIKHGVDILTHYHEKNNGSTKHALLSYNAGYTAMIQGRAPIKYVNKFNVELTAFTKLGSQQEM